MADHPAHPRHLSGTKWTSAAEPYPYRHWEVASVKGQDVVLIATLDRSHRVRIPWRTLRDRTVWQPGWQPT